MAGLTNVLIPSYPTNPTTPDSPINRNCVCYDIVLQWDTAYANFQKYAPNIITGINKQEFDDAVHDYLLNQHYEERYGYSGGYDDTFYWHTYDFYETGKDTYSIQFDLREFFVRLQSYFLSPESYSSVFPPTVKFKFTLSGYNQVIAKYTIDEIDAILNQESYFVIQLDGLPNLIQSDPNYWLNGYHIDGRCNKLIITIDLVETEGDTEEPDNPDIPVNPPVVTGYKIATISEAASIGGMQVSNNRCILFRELSTYGCSLKFPIPSGINYLSNQAVQLRDIGSQVITINNNTYYAQLAYGLVYEGSYYTPLNISNYHYNGWQGFYSVTSDDNTRTITVNLDLSSSPAGYSDGVIILVSPYLHDVNNNVASYAQNVSILSVEVKNLNTGSTINNYNMECIWEDEKLGQDSQQSFSVRLYDNTTQNTQITVTYKYKLENDSNDYESNFILKYNRKMPL